MHVEPVILNVLNSHVDTQRPNNRAATQVTVNTLNQKVLGHYALIAVTNFNVIDQDAPP